MTRSHTGTLVLLCALCVLGTVAHGARLDVPYYWQSSNTWCWAASSVMLAKHYNLQPREGTQIKPWWSAHLLNKGAADSGAWSDYSAILASLDPARTYEHTDLLDLDSTRNLIVSQLDNGHPLVFRCHDTLTNDHAVVITGYVGTNDVTGRLYINDPSGSLFKDTVSNRLCGVEVSWATFFDTIDTSPDPDGHIISAASGSSAAGGAAATVDFCPEHISTTIKTTEPGLLAKVDVSNHLDLKWDGSLHPGIYYDRAGTVHSAIVGGWDYGWKFSTLDELELYPVVTCHVSNKVDAVLNTYVKCLGATVFSSTTNFVVDPYTHSYDERRVSIPVSAFVGGLAQEECEILVVLETRTYGSSDAFMESDRACLGCRVELLSGHTASWPDVPVGRTCGGVDEELVMTSGHGSCSGGHMVEYRFSWDDGTFSDWSTNSGSAHAWSSAGSYEVTAQCRCMNDIGITSAWSESKSVLIGTPIVHYVWTNGLHVWPYTNWVNAARDVQSALNAAAAGEVVRATNGIYALTSEVRINDAVLVESVNGYGDTVLDGGDATVCLELYHADAVFDGFTLTGGAEAGGYGGSAECIEGGTIRNCMIRDSMAHSGAGVCLRNNALLQDSTVSNNLATVSGGGVYCYESGIVSNCVIVENTAGWGGGIYIRDAGEALDSEVMRNTGTNYGGGIYCRTSAVIDSCDIFCNTGRISGGVYLNGDECVIRNSSIASNRATSGAGGVRCYQGGRVEGCEVIGNTAPTGAGIYISERGEAVGCVARGNIAGTYGGGFYCYRGGNVRDCLVTANSAITNRAGGIYCLEGGTVRNCTVIGNYGKWGGGLYCRNGGTVVNTIMYTNSSPNEPQNWYANGTNISYSYCCTTPLVTGESNITDNPLLLDMGSGDYRLSPGSACIDSGTMMPAGIGLDGVPHPLDGDNDGHAAMDMGAYEFVHSSADTDGDIMPDAWELASGLNATNAQDAAVDYDGDALDNLEEWIAGTIPTNAGSVLSITGTAADTNQHNVLTWNSSSGRVYAVYCAPDLLTPGPFVMLTNSLAATPPENTYTDTVSAAESLIFYSISAQLP